MRFFQDIGHHFFQYYVPQGTADKRLININSTHFKFILVHEIPRKFDKDQKPDLSGD